MSCQKSCSKVPVVASRRAVPEARHLQVSAEHATGASPRALEFQVGSFAAPVTLGAQADVVIAGAGAVEARVYFDGSTLFACSVSLDQPLIVNELALGTLWAPVFCPALLRLGEVQLEYVAAHAEVRPTRRKLMPDPWGGHTLLMSSPEPTSRLGSPPEVVTAFDSPPQNTGFETITVIAPLVATLDEFEALGSVETNRGSSLPP